MYATRTRRARPEPFAVRPGIAERLGLPYMDAPLLFAAVGAGRLQHLHPRPGDRRATCPADPDFFADRQAIYAGLGMRRHDTS